LKTSNHQLNHIGAQSFFWTKCCQLQIRIGKALLELADKETNSITLEELSLPFAKHITNHLRISDKQGTFSSSKFLDACRKFQSR
jgi:hypothetical protein